jgi:hypothetical protein
VSTASILLVLRLVSEGVGVASQISELAKRAQAGEEISDAEIEQARKEVAESVANWDAETGGAPAP